MQLWVTLGGGGRSSGFSSIGKDPDAQRQFLTALVQLVKDQELFGVDFDCEEFSGQQDFRNYLKLILQAADVLHQANVQVSVALHAGQVLPYQVYSIIDRIHLMAYDMLTGEYHASQTAVKEAVDGLLESGCPAHKIVLGIPAYARHYQTPTNVMTFAEIVDSVEVFADNFYAQGEWEGFRYDSPKRIAAKVDYAKQMGLGGVFFWELGQDKQHSSARGGILLELAARGASETLLAPKNEEL